MDHHVGVGVLDGVEHLYDHRQARARIGRAAVGPLRQRRVGDGFEHDVRLAALVDARAV